MNKNIQYKKLTDICEIITGEWGTEITENSQNIVSVIRTTNFLNNGKIDIQNKELIKREIDKKKIEQKQLKRGDIIIEKSGGSPNQPVGRVVFFSLNSNEVFLCNNFTSILRVKEDINSKYIFYFLRNNYKKNKVVKYQNKTTGIINLKLQNYLNESCIFLPELKIQNKIVNILDNLENIIEKNQNYLTHLGVLTKSLFTTMFGDIKTNDKNWEIRKIEDCTLNNVKNIDLKTNGEITYIDISSINNKENIISSYKKYDNIREAPSRAKKILNENDILISTVRPALKNIAIFNKKNSGLTIGSTGFCVLRPKDTIDSKYIFEIIKSNNFTETLIKKQIGANYPAVSDRDIKSIKIPVPPIELQNKFAERIEKIEKLKFTIMTIILKAYETMKKKGVEKD